MNNKEKNKLDLVFVLDKSSSMHHNQEEVCKKFNDKITEYREKKIGTKVTLVKFNDKIEEVYFREPIENVEFLDPKDYKTSGGTAYFDAVVETARKIRNITNPLTNHKVVFWIVTNSYDNSSGKKNTYGKNNNFNISHFWDKIKETQKTKYGWEFWQTTLGVAYFIECGLKTDAIEKTPEYIAAMKDISRRKEEAKKYGLKQTDEILDELTYYDNKNYEPGDCNFILQDLSVCLLKDYGIEWKSPIDMNPDVRFF